MKVLPASIRQILKRHLRRSRSDTTQGRAERHPSLDRLQAHAARLPAWPDENTLRTKPMDGVPSSSLHTQQLAMTSDAAHVIKVIARPDTPRDVSGWANEALFYAELRDRLGPIEFDIPELVGLNVRDDGSLAMLLTYMPHTAQARRRDAMQRAIKRFAALGARTSLNADLRTADWLGAAQAVPALSPGGLDVSFIQFCAALDISSVADVFAAFHRHADALQDLYDQSPPCLVHGDPHPNNILCTTPDGIRQTLIDWGDVRRGALGDDLARLLNPWMMLYEMPSSDPQISAVEDHFISLYLDVLREKMPEKNMNDVRTSFEIRSVHSAIRAHRRFMALTEQTRSPERRAARQHALARYYMHISARAERLMRRAA